MVEFMGYSFNFGDTSSFISGSSLGSLITWIVIICIFVIIISILIYLWIDSKNYNLKIILFENIGGGGYRQTYTDRARLVKIGDGGEEILRLKKKKVFRGAYGKKMSKNTYWFAVGQDGYWYNIVLGDLDAKMGMLDIEPIERDMRYMHVAVRKNIQERYRKIGFREKYGMMIISAIFLFIMVIAVWFLIKEVGSLINAAQQTVEASNQVIEPLKQILSKMDTICQGGSGTIPIN